MSIIRGGHWELETKKDPASLWGKPGHRLKMLIVMQQAHIEFQAI